MGGGGRQKDEKAEGCKVLGKVGAWECKNGRWALGERVERKTSAKGGGRLEHRGTLRGRDAAPGLH